MSPGSKVGRILAISSHIDDAEMGCGGSLLAHAQEGAQIHVAVLQSDDHLAGDIGTRLKEQEHSARVLGASVHYFMSSQGDKEIIGKLDEIHPTLIYLPFEKDYHPDHRRAHIIGMSVGRKFEATVLAYFSTTSYDYWPNAMRVINLKEKLELISVFKSQINRRPEYLKILEAQNNFFSTLLPCMGQDAEGFYAHRIIL